MVSALRRAKVREAMLQIHSPQAGGIKSMVTALGARIRAARLAAGWTQGELAKRAHVSQQAISQLETGVATETRYILAIAKALGLPADSFAPENHSRPEFRSEKNEPSRENKEANIAHRAATKALSEVVGQLLAQLTRSQQEELLAWIRATATKNQEILRDLDGPPPRSNGHQ
jgi:transcriptional regulator with XRE-family HTH domain